jgi:hypothetical protein
MKKQTACENSKIEQFEIREPRWALVVCLLAAIGFIVGAVVMFCWSLLGKIEKNTFIWDVFSSCSHLCVL